MHHRFFSYTRNLIKSQAKKSSGFPFRDYVASDFGSLFLPLFGKLSKQEFMKLHFVLKNYGNMMTILKKMDKCVEIFEYAKIHPSSRK